MTGEWYIPGHKLRGFLVRDFGSFSLGEPSKGEVRVDTIGMVRDGEELRSIEIQETSSQIGALRNPHFLDEIWKEVRGLSFEFEVGCY